MFIFRQSNRFIVIVILIALFISAAVLMFFNRNESAIAVLTSETSTPTTIATATVGSLRNSKFLKDMSLIHVDAGCDAPCWRGITPGKTSYQDAMSILRDDLDLDGPFSLSVADSAPAIGSSWDSASGEPCCQLVSDDGVTVAAIFLQLAPDITVKQLIDVRGEPEYVLDNSGKEAQAIINLLYPKHGMIAFAFVAGAATGALTESSEIIGVYYATPKSLDLSIKLGNFYGWKGYKPFSAYAPDAVAPDFKVTQSVTLTASGTATPLPSG